MEAHTTTTGPTSRSLKAQRRQRMGLTGNLRRVSERTIRTVATFWPRQHFWDYAEFDRADTALHGASFMAKLDSDDEAFLRWASEAAFEVKWSLNKGCAA